MSSHTRASSTSLPTVDRRDEVGPDRPQIFDEIVEQAITRGSIDIVNARRRPAHR
jgi:hypothetical protein